jgi:hypothetical protein
VSGHDDLAAEPGVVGVERRDPVTFVGGEQGGEDGAAVRVELARDLLPVQRLDPLGV